MEKKISRILTVALTFIFLIGGSLSIKAQESNFDEFTLDEITVTAEKREQNVQKVPVAMDVILGDQLALTGKSTLDEVLSSVSTTMITQTTTEMFVSIRGLDNDNMPGEGAAPVAVVIDGVYSNTFGLGFYGMNDVERIEVLSGPQSTLYGRNSSGGVVHVVSKAPDPESFDASGTIEFGNFNKIATSGLLNVPVSDKSAFRSAVSYIDRDGYNTNGTDDDNAGAARLKYLYNFNDDVSIVILAQFTRIKGKGQGDGVVPFATEDSVDNPYTGRWDAQIFDSTKDIRRYSLTLDWATPIGTVTFVPSAQSSNNWTGRAETERTDEGAVLVGPRFAQDFEDEISGELRIASDEDSFMEYIAGIYYYEKEWNQSSTSSMYLHAMYRYNEQEALFANVKYPISDKFRLGGGLRHTRDTGESGTGDWNLDGTISGRFDHTIYHKDSKHTDYRFGAELDFGENSMLWADYATGYQMGPTQAGSLDQTLNSYQLGSKNRFLDRRAQFNATAWYYAYENFQVRGISEDYVDPDSGEIFEDSGTGISNAVLYGFDMDANYLLTGRDTIRVAYSYLHTEIDNLTVIFNYLPDSAEYNGLSLNNSPEHTITASYEHRFDLPNSASLTASIDTRYYSEYFLNSIQALNDPSDQFNTEPSSTITNLSFNYLEPNGKWSINAYVKNIEDHAKKNGTNSTNYSTASFRLDPPRTFGVVLSLRY